MLHQLVYLLGGMETVISEVAQTTGIELKLEQEKAFIQGNDVFVSLPTGFGKSLIGRAKRAPHWGVKSIFRVIYMCRFVCLGMPKCVGGITWPKNTHAQFWAVKMT